MRHDLTRGAYKPQGNNLGYTITNTTEYGLNSPQGNNLGHNPHPTRWNEKQKKMETKINMKQRNLKQEVDHEQPLPLARSFALCFLSHFFSVFLFVYSVLLFCVCRKHIVLSLCSLQKSDCIHLYSLFFCSPLRCLCFLSAPVPSAL